MEFVKGMIVNVINNNMKLLTKEIEKRFAKVGDQSEVENPIVIVKFFNPCGQGTWFATEYNSEEKIFYGYVSLFNEKGMNEWGSFSLEELESIDVGFGLGIERDAYCTEKTVNEWKEQMSIV